ncbi:MAG: ABC transporter ATP-binding protein [Solirubrobacteraceae bacterium]
MIEVKNLKKSFSSNEILKGVNTSFESGQTTLIIGGSGAGKTVLLKCLIGLEKPTSGDIIYNGLSLGAMDSFEQQELRKKIGVGFQGGALFDFLDVKGNIQFPLDMFTNLTRIEKEIRVKQVLERVNLPHAKDKMPNELSGGMKKRVSIARAIVNNPDFLFFDEPNSGLDPTTSVLIDKLIQEITQEYKTITVINTHDMNSVLEIGEKIVFLKDGILEWEGNNKDILYTPNEYVGNFVYSSELFKNLRKNLINKGKT